MLLKDLKINKKKRKQKRRVGRGPGSGLGKTSGKGHKGQKARSGGTKQPWFEGGQQRLTQRLPKVGFTNIFRTEYKIVNVDTLDKKFNDGDNVTKETLYSKGIIKKKNAKIKILGKGGLTKKLIVEVDKLSHSAIEKIKNAGGEVKNIK